MTLLETLLNIYTQEPLTTSERKKTVAEMRVILEAEERRLAEEDPGLFNPMHTKGDEDW